MPVAVAVSVCWTPAAGAGKVARQVIDAPAASTVLGQTIWSAVMSESVTVTGSRVTLPVLVTTNVTVNVPGVVTWTPGAVLASSPLIFLTTEIPGVEPK